MLSRHKGGGRLATAAGGGTGHTAAAGSGDRCSNGGSGFPLCAAELIAEAASGRGRPLCRCLVSSWQISRWCSSRALHDCG